MYEIHPYKPKNEFHEFLRRFIGILVDFKAKNQPLKNWQIKEIEKFNAIIARQNVLEILRKTRATIAAYEEWYNPLYWLESSAYKREVIDELSNLLKEYSEASLFESLRKVNDQYIEITSELISKEKKATVEKNSAQKDLGDFQKEFRKIIFHKIPEMQGEIEKLKLKIESQSTSEKQAPESCDRTTEGQAQKKEASKQDKEDTHNSPGYKKFF